MNLKEIKQAGKLFAIIIRKDFETTGVNFVTSKDNTLQLGVLKHGKNYRIKSHFHKPNKRVIRDTQEVLHIIRGKIKVDFYDKEKFDSVTLYEGDTILFIHGGHGIEMLEDSKMVEVKQGPYMTPEVDKEVIE